MATYGVIWPVLNFSVLAHHILLVLHCFDSATLLLSVWPPEGFELHFRTRLCIIVLTDSPTSLQLTVVCSSERQVFLGGDGGPIQGELSGGIAQGFQC